MAEDTKWQLADLKEMSVAHIHDQPAHSTPGTLTHWDKPTIERHKGRETTEEEIHNVPPGPPPLTREGKCRPPAATFLWYWACTLTPWSSCALSPPESQVASVWRGVSCALGCQVAAAAWTWCRQVEFSESSWVNTSVFVPSSYGEHWLSYKGLR